MSRDGDVALAAAFGVARRDKHVLMDTQTRFQVGSVSKWFTTLLVLKLVDEHKLALDQSITSLLPGYPATVGDSVTVADLLSNTIGIKDRLPTELINRPDMSASSMSAAQATTLYGHGQSRTGPQPSLGRRAKA
ncbi:serine hydrolase domain-containing protein [Rhodanobacter sp. L36]|uniref:serine hydrolase domain-containing protein n=1 Tax=Rhodanobacter sp. L36 TaxID=1747221 RepID=UPI0020B12D2C|nr:serine hydrolase domain-containing protein [Rhodanobacter sp. L36]